MHPEDRYILTNMVSYVDITHDIYFACQEDWIGSKALEEIQEIANETKRPYQDILVECFEQWYMEKACPEQQLLVDLNGFISLNDQFDDLQTIVAKDIEDNLLIDFESITKKLNNESEEDKLKRQLQEMIEGGCGKGLGLFNKLSSSENSPIRTRKDLYDLPNMVYLLNHSNKLDWANLVNSLLFRLKHNNYNGVTIESAFEWLIHSRNIKQIEYRNAMQEVYSMESIEQDDSDSFEVPKETKKSFMGFVLKLKQNQEEGYAKKAIKRGLKTLSSILSPKEISLFNSGDGFVVESSLFNYRFRKSGVSIIKQTLNPVGNHVPFDLIVMNKDNVELCYLCIYFDETPVIDQIIATVMHLKFEDGEKEMLEVGNFFNKKDDFYNDKTMHSFLNRKNSDIENDFEDDLITDLPTENQTVYHDEIKQAVFNALPNFIGSKLPELVYSDFSNLVFDDILSHYQMADTEDKVVSPLIYEAIESI